MEMPEFKFIAKLYVAGKCERCKSRIENKVKKEEGVYSAKWDIKNQELEIQYEYPIMKIEEVIKAILSIGHDTESYKAEDMDYKLLPESCQYREH